MSQVSTVYLKHARKVNRCGRTCHIYLPESMEGQEVIGIILREPTNINHDV